MTCTRHACFAEAAWRVVLVLTQPGGHKSRGSTGFLICGAHRNTFTLDDVFDTLPWSKLSDELDAEGYARPVKRLTSLEFEALQ